MDFDPGVLAEAMVRLRRALSDNGLQIEFLSDIYEYKDRVESTRGQAIDSQFSPMMFDFHPSNFIGLFLVNEKKEVVGAQSLRLENLGTSNLRKIIYNQQDRLYGQGPQGGKLSSSFSSGTNTISGQTVYHGGLWLSEECQRKRRHSFNTGAAFIKYAHLVSHAKWYPDFIYGYMKPKSVYKGLAAQYWIPHVLPYMFQWEEVPDQHQCLEWEFLCYLTQFDLVEQTALISNGRFLNH